MIAVIVLYHLTRLKRLIEIVEANQMPGSPASLLQQVFPCLRSRQRRSYITMMQPSWQRNDTTYQYTNIAQAKKIHNLAYPLKCPACDFVYCTTPVCQCSNHNMLAMTKLTPSLLNIQIIFLLARD